jgi:hypothetical protein
MSCLSDEELAALKLATTQGEAARARRAEMLVNPASGLANDYLNLFNEIVMLIETLPTMPDLFEDIQRWRPTSYREYFRQSILPGRGSAIENYDKLDARFRRSFESIVEELDRRSTGAVAAVRRQFKLHEHDPEALTAICERAGANIREVLDRATSLVNNGAVVTGDLVQARTDELMSTMQAPAA